MGDYAVIGMGAVVGRKSHIGQWSIVAEGSVVPGGKSVQDETIVAGIPAKPIGPVTEKHRKYWIWAKEMYRELARDYEANLERLDGN
jgi:carbonic anhydrase/acetyltransferase-like protein (isoleucine patch superfamily)